MAKNKAKKMMVIKQMMKSDHSPATSLPKPNPHIVTLPSGEPPSKRIRPEDTDAGGVSGDVLDDNFMQEAIVSEDEGHNDALDGGSDVDSDDAGKARVAENKKRKHEVLKEKKKAKAGQAPCREDSAAISSAGARDKAQFFLVDFYYLCVLCACLHDVNRSPKLCIPTTS